MFCKNCGTKQADDTAFCSNCGTKVGDEKLTQDSIRNQQPANMPKAENTKEKQKMPSKRLLTILIIALIGIALVLVVRSCNGGGSSSPERLIVGEWHSDWGETWTFQRNERVQIREGRESASGTFNVSRDNALSITLVFPWGDEEVTVTWAESEDNIGRGEWFVTSERLFFEGDVFVRR